MSASATSAAAVATPRREPSRLDARGFASLIFLAAMVAIGILAPVVAPYSPTQQDIANVLAPPGRDHWLGTDDLGRDVLSRLLHGTGASLYASVLAVSVGIVLGVPVGLAAGFFGGWIDEIVSRFIDALLSFPGIVLAIGVTGALGIGLTNAMIAVGIVFAPTLARLARSRTLVIRHELFVDAARCFGARPRWILRRHILPNAVQPLVIQVTLLLAAALLAEASLSFLGLGVQAPDPSWGAMLARGYTYMEVAPDQMYAPGLAILLTALAFNTLGESLRIVLDPTARRT